MRTQQPEYAERLAEAQCVWWKRLLDVQAPYRRHLRSLCLGRTLDLGCGVGRNLATLDGGVGVDHNPAAVEMARRRGFEAFTPEAFRTSLHAVPGRFDALLVSHVAEHMTHDEAAALLREYLPFVRQGGRVVLIAPQQLGFRSDPTHVEFVDFAAAAALVTRLGLALERQYSFPFPRAFGRVFKYNEFVSIARKAGAEPDEQ